MTRAWSGMYLDVSPIIAVIWIVYQSHKMHIYALLMSLWVHLTSLKETSFYLLYLFINLDEGWVTTVPDLDLKIWEADFRLILAFHAAHTCIKRKCVPSQVKYITAIRLQYWIRLASSECRNPIKGGNWVKI